MNTSGCQVGGLCRCQQQRNGGPSVFLRRSWSRCGHQGQQECLMPIFLLIDPCGCSRVVCFPIFSAYLKSFPFRREGRLCTFPRKRNQRQERRTLRSRFLSYHPFPKRPFFDDLQLGQSLDTRGKPQLVRDEVDHHV